VKAVAALVAAGALAVVGTASATAPPVGPLPAAKVTSVKTTRGQLVSIALPTRRGYVWRVARPAGLGAMSWCAGKRQRP